MKTIFTCLLTFLFFTSSASKLIYFDVTYENSVFYIYWQTCNETAKSFDIYISIDGHNYDLIATQEAYNDSVNSYEVEHKKSNNNKKTYLKLVEVCDNNSNLLAVTVANVINNRYFYPVFTKDFILFKKDFNENEIQIFDCLGRLIQSNEYKLSNRQLNVKNLSKGQYFIVFNDNDTDIFIKH